MSPIRRLYSGTSPLGINHGMRIRSSAHDVTAPTSQRHPPAVHPIGTSHLGLQIALRPRSFLADHRRGVVMPWRPLVKRMDMSSSAQRVPHRYNECHGKSGHALLATGMPLLPLPSVQAPTMWDLCARGQHLGGPQRRSPGPGNRRWERNGPDGHRRGCRHGQSVCTPGHRRARPCGSCTRRPALVGEIGSAEIPLARSTFSVGESRRSRPRGWAREHSPVRTAEAPRNTPLGIGVLLRRPSES